MQVATVAPSGNVWVMLQDAKTMVPTHSMPRMRGKATLGECPWRVKSSERLRPKAWMRMRIWLEVGVGMGTVVRCRAEGGPGEESSAQRMVEE